MQPATILLPLYIYPSLNAWEPLSNAISQNSDVNFTIIINVDSGPGEAATPNSDYTSAIVKLNEAPNVETVGYVRTNYTDRDINDVLRDIETYSGWSQSNSSLAMSGIFFDETPNDYSLRKQRYLGTANKAVKNSVGIQQPKMIIHNPGTISDARLVGPLVDITVAFENSFGQYQQNNEALQSLSADRSSYSFMVHSVPSGQSIRGLLRDMSRPAQYLFVTTATERYYESFNDSWGKTLALRAIAGYMGDYDGGVAAYYTS